MSGGGRVDIDVDKVVARLKDALSKAGIMEVLTDLMIISEVWAEDSVVHVVAWIPDVDPQSRRLRYRRKHILYDVVRDRVLGIRDEGG